FSARRYPPYAKAHKSKMMTMMMQSPARLLTRIGSSGAGCKSTPVGGSIGATPGAVLDLAEVLSPVFTNDLHFLSFLARSEHQLGTFEEPVHDIHLLLDAIIGHFTFPVAS